MMKNRPMNKTNAPPAEVTAAVALLEKLGYAVTAPPAPEPPVELPATYLDDDVREAQALVDRLRMEEEDADARAMSTALNDPELPRVRDQSIKAGDRLAEAEEALKKAIADRAFMRGE